MVLNICFCFLTSFVFFLSYISFNSIFSSPTIFLKNTATASTVIDNVNGYISENSTGAFSDKIIDAIEDKKSYEKICKNAYIDLYKTWDETIDKVYDAYIDLINNK